MPKLSTPQPVAPLKSNEKQKDQTSHSHNAGTKYRQVAQLVGRKCLVWCEVKTRSGTQGHKYQSWKSQAKIHPISDLLKGEEQPMALRFPVHCNLELAFQHNMDNNKKYIYTNASAMLKQFACFLTRFKALQFLLKYRTQYFKVLSTPKKAATQT